jgi:hypothetical protein
MKYQIPATITGMGHSFRVGGTEVVDMNISNIQLNRPLNLNSNTATGSYINGDIYYDGTDIKAVVPAGTINLTSGTSGANTTLSNLGTTAINTDLLFDAATHDIGDSTNPVDNINVKTVRLRTDVGVGVANIPNIYSSTSITLDLNIPLSGTMVLKENGTSKYTWTGSTFTAPNQIITNTFNINNSSYNPTINGEFARNGNDVKVYSGGALRNMSDMLEQGLTNINFLYGQDITSTGSSLDHKVPSGDMHKFYISGTDTMEISVLGIGVEDGRYIQPIGSSDVIGIMPKQPTSTLSIGSRGTILLPNQASSSHPPTSSTLDTWFGNQSGACGLQYNSTQSAGTGRYRLWARHGTDWVRTEMS